MSASPNGIPRSTPPYLSVVVTARNDDHGGNLLGRMQAFVNGLLAQCHRHELSAELIIVEWNPPGGRPRLSQALAWPAAPDFCNVRIIEVPAELHERYQHHKALPLYQMIAKNIGIRRAHGEFILATNIDIIFSDELIAFVAQKRLRPGKMYRIDRWDVMSDVPVDGTVEEQLEYCRSHLIRVNSREGTFKLAADGQRVLEPVDIATGDNGLTIGKGWFPREMSGDEPFRWVDNNAEVVIAPSRDPARVLLLDIEPGPGMNLGTFLLEIINAAGELVSSTWVTRRSIVTLPVPSSTTEPIRLRLHTKRGGLKISSDPRTLNFRVFRCAVEKASRVAELLAKAESARTTVITAQATGARAKRGLRLVRDIWRGTPGVEIRLPVSPEKLEKLQLRQDDTGVTFSAEPLRGLLRRWTNDESSGEAKILGPGLNAVWSAGWYPVESHAGDTFRWTRNGSSLVVLLSTGAAELGMEIESGPALGHQPFELEIRDQSGAALVTAHIKGRTEVKVPLPGRPGAFPLSFHARGGGPPREVRGDSRDLVFRIFRCRLAQDTIAAAQKLTPGEIGFTGSGVWRTNGWSDFTDPNGRRWLGVSNEAELLLRCPEGPKRKPMFMVAAGPGAISEAIALSITDPAGGLLYRGDIVDRQEFSMDGDFLPGNYYALRFHVEREGAVNPDEPLLLLSAITWTAEESGDAVQIFVEPSAVNRRTATSAVHLHTNGCGDFTMIAREHWMDLRGYPEFDVFSMNIDSVFCWAAHHGGAREEVLPDPMRIYHIEHGTGSGWTPEGQQKLFQRIAAKGLPWLDYEDVLHWARIMNRFDAPMIFNHHDWGLAGESLEEVTPWPQPAPSETEQYRSA